MLGLTLSEFRAHYEEIVRASIIEILDAHHLCYVSRIHILHAISLYPSFITPTWPFRSAARDNDYVL